LECNAIWFDQWESTQLSPDGVVALFQLINERGGTASTVGAKFGQGLRCVTCGDGMKVTNDRVRNTRFTYQSCLQGHGRFTTFYNFLAEKQFVRELTPAERTKLATSVKQIKCSGCGAPVDLGKTDACGYCRAPVSVFDRDAAKKAIDHYLQERGKQMPSRPTLEYGHHGHTGHTAQWDTWDKLYAADLATDLLWALGRGASRGLAGFGLGGAAAGAASATGALADRGVAAAGGLLDSVPVGGDSLRSATDALFGDAALSSAGSALSSAGQAVSSVGDALPSATDALFGGGGDAFSSLADSVSSGIGSIGGDAIEGASSGAMDAIGDVASAGGDSVVDLVSDGIGSLLGGLFG
jgi:hypothetical protein